MTIDSDNAVDDRLADNPCSATNHRSSASCHPQEPTQRTQDSAAKRPQMDAQLQWQWPQLVRTKRQNPDWKPRRASVSSCQQQVIHNYHFSEFSEHSNQQPYTTGSSRKIQSYKQQQQQQIFPQRRRYLTEATEPETSCHNLNATHTNCMNKVNSGAIGRRVQSQVNNNNDDDDDDDDGDELPPPASVGGRSLPSNNCEHSRRHYNTTHCNGRHRRLTCCEPLARDQTQSILVVYNWVRATSKEKPLLQQQELSTNECVHKLSQNSILRSSASLPEHQKKSKRKKKKKQKQQHGELDRLNVSSLNSYSSSDQIAAPNRDSPTSQVNLGQLETKTTICRNGQPPAESTCEPLQAGNLVSQLSSGQINSIAATSAALTTVTMNEKLQIQDKQRKFLIILMALRKMISMDSGLVSIQCAGCSSKSRRTSVCSSSRPKAGLKQKKSRPYREKLKQRRSKNKKNQQKQNVAGSNQANCRSQQQSTRDLSLQAQNLEKDASKSAKESSFSASEDEEEENNSVSENTSTVRELNWSSSEREGSSRLIQSKSPDCSYSRGDNCNQEPKPELSGEESDQNLIKMTRDEEEMVAAAPERYHRQDNEHLQCSLNTTRDYCGSEARSSRASYESESAEEDGNNKCISNEQEEDEELDDEDTSLESLIVESWLDDHPDFVHDYFMRKASRHLIDDWLVTRAKVSNTSLIMSSQLDLRNLSHTGENMQQQQQQQVCYAPASSHSGGVFRTGSASPARLAPPKASPSTPVQSPLFCQDQQQPLQRVSVGNFRPASSRNQSGAATPVRKISATDFESRTGSGYLRPMVSTTPDGRPTFLSPSSADGLAINDGVEEAVNRQQMATRPKLSGCLNVKTENQNNNNNANNTNNNNNDNDTHDEHDDNFDDEDKAPKEEVKLIFELVKDICNDLDIRTLLHKILRNIAVLINADKSSLFLVCGEPGDPNRHLVSQLFNVDQDSSECAEPETSDCIRIPWSTGLVGYVAESGEFVNIANCYEDPRFTDTVDQRTGYVTKHMLCAPIYDKRNEIVGVAQVINKRDGKPFSKQDEFKFKRYLQFCGIGLRNAQSYENCQLENKRNQVLLDLARMVFEEQSTIEQVVYRIMLHTQSLLECQRCQVLLIDDGSDDLDHLFELTNQPSNPPYNQQQQQQQNNHHSKPEPATTATSNVANVSINWRPQFTSFLPNNCTSSNNSNSDCKNQITYHNKPATKLFSLVFDLECDGQDLVMHSNKTGPDLAIARAKTITTTTMNGSKLETTAGGRPFPMNIGITSFVAMTGETLNIEDAHLCERFDPSVDEGSSFRHKSILCMPIRNGQRQIIGVSQLINKKNGRPFNKNDEDLFEAFSIFCGLGIHNTLMYEKVLKVMAKQRVTFEVLSYHATAPLEEAKKLHLEQVPSCFSLNLASLKFNDFSLDEQFMLKSCVRFFLDLDLMRRFQIDQLVFCNWILSVQKNYRKVTYHPIVGGNGLKAAPVRYHNWRHAFNVSQMMFAILINTHMCTALGELETLALLIACLCHDLDHRGTNNSFQIKSASPLAELYSTSTMEHHHFDQCVMILNSQGNQILANLSPDEYSRVIKLLEEAILATDLANYFQKRELFFQLVNSNKFDWHNNPEHRSLLRCMLMTACDVAAITKPWSIQKVVADLVMSEFYQQGDIEKQELNIEPIDLMNRDKMSELPEMQIGFIDSICAPIYTAFAKLFPHELSPLLEGCFANRNLWVEVKKQNNDSRLDLASYLNNNSTSNMNMVPRVRNTSSPDVNLVGNLFEQTEERKAPACSQLAHTSASLSSATRSRLDNKSPVPTGEYLQSHPKLNFLRKSV